MSYADLLDDEGIPSRFLAVLKPRRIVDSTTWVQQELTTTYKASFTFGEVITLKDDGTALDVASSTALSNGDWFYDTDNQELYIDIGGDPSTSQIVVTYEIYVGTIDSHINRVPTDSSTRVVYFEPIIQRSPEVISSASDSLFGVLPTQTSQLILSNATHLLEQHVSQSSFNKADIDIYHSIGDLENDNIKLIFKGSGKEVLYNDDQILISVFDRTNDFNVEYRNPVGNSFYGTTAFSELDPDFNAKSIRQVYGVVDGFIPVNIDFDSVSPTTSDNRTWLAIQEVAANLPQLSSSVPASPSSTTTRTYVSSANGFRVGDSVFIDSASGSGFDEHVIVTAVNKTGSNYIEHAAITNIAATGSDCKRSFIGILRLVQSDASYDLLFDRDFDEYFDATNSVAGFTLKSTAEANTGASTFDPTTDFIYARVYGKQNDVTLGGSAFGSDSTETNNLTNGIVILFDLMKNLGLTESEIDTSQFTTLQSSISDELGFAIPGKATENFPNNRDLIADLTMTLLLKIFLNDSNVWSARQIAPLSSTVDKTIEDDEIVPIKSLNYDFLYNEILSDVFVEYAFREVNNKDRVSELGSASRVSSTSTVATELHNIKKQKTFKSQHILTTEVQTFADRLKFIFGDRRGILRFRSKKRFFDTELNDVIRVTRARMPGFSFDKDTDRSTDFSVLSSRKSLRSVEIELDDQKGIEDNESSWS